MTGRQAELVAIVAPETDERQLEREMGTVEQSMSEAVNSGFSDGIAGGLDTRSIRRKLERAIPGGGILSDLAGGGGGVSGGGAVAGGAMGGEGSLVALAAERNELLEDIEQKLTKVGLETVDGGGLGFGAGAAAGRFTAGVGAGAAGAGILSRLLGVGGPAAGGLLLPLLGGSIAEQAGGAPGILRGALAQSPLLAALSTGANIGNLLTSQTGPGGPGLTNQEQIERIKQLQEEGFISEERANRLIKRLRESKIEPLDSAENFVSGLQTTIQKLQNLEVPRPPWIDVLLGQTGGGSGGARPRGGGFGPDGEPAQPGDRGAENPFGPGQIPGGGPDLPGGGGTTVNGLPTGFMGPSGGEPPGGPTAAARDAFRESGGSNRAAREAFTRAFREQQGNTRNRAAEKKRQESGDTNVNVNVTAEGASQRDIDEAMEQAKREAKRELSRELSRGAGRPL